MVVLAMSTGGGGVKAAGMSDSPGPAVIRKRASGGGSVPDRLAASV